MADNTLTPPVRRCTTCGVEKPATLEFFYRHSGAARFGLQPKCKACFAEYARARRGENREAKREACRRSYAKHAVVRREKARARAAFARATRPEHVRTLKMAAAARIRAENGPRLIRKRMSQLVFASIKNRIGGGKAGRRWLDLVGYDLPTLMRHVERQFRPGMNWENWGSVWHLDHIQPVKSFSITSIDCPEFRACWALTNLRPLAVKENLAKGARRLLLL